MRNKKKKELPCKQLQGFWNVEWEATVTEHLGDRAESL